VDLMENDKQSIIETTKKQITKYLSATLK
jgi:hypothetical protein